MKLPSDRLYDRRNFPIELFQSQVKIHARNDDKEEESYLFSLSERRNLPQQMPN
jgi:hypothetical protein